MLYSVMHLISVQRMKIKMLMVLKNLHRLEDKMIVIVIKDRTKKTLDDLEVKNEEVEMR